MHHLSSGKRCSHAESAKARRIPRTAVAVVFLGDALSVGFVFAAILMALGVWLHLTEHHEHLHYHEPMEHEHLHTHDEHPQHAHSPSDPPGEPHSHPHRHEALTHSQPHY